MITAKLIGFNELRRDLKKLPVKIQKQVLRASIRKGAKLVADTAKTTTAFSDDTGKLRKSIKAKTARDKPGMIGAIVEVEEWYGRLVEKGFTVKRATGFEARGGNTRHFNKTTQGPATQLRKKFKIGKFVGPRPFLVPALNQNRGAILSEIRDSLASLLKKKLGFIK